MTHDRDEMPPARERQGDQQDSESPEGETERGVRFGYAEHVRANWDRHAGAMRLLSGTEEDSASGQIPTE